MGICFLLYLSKINGSTERGQMLLLNGSVPFYFFAGGYFYKAVQQDSTASDQPGVREKARSRSWPGEVTRRNKRRAVLKHCTTRLFAKCYQIRKSQQLLQRLSLLGECCRSI